MKIKSLLLSAAAGLAAVAGTSFVGVTTAQAQNVQVGTQAICGVQSGNYYVLPGSQICFQLGGRIQFGMSYTSHSTPPFSPILSGAFIDQTTYNWNAQLSFRTRSVSNIGNTRSRFVLNIGQVTTSSPTAPLVGLYDHDANPATPPIVVTTGLSGYNAAAGTVQYDHDGNPATPTITIPALVVPPNDGLEITLANGGTAAAGLFPFLLAGTAAVTTSGMRSIGTFPNAGFAGNTFRFVRGTTILSGNANDPVTGLPAGAQQPMAVFGSTPWSQTFNTGDGNVNIPRVTIHDSGIYTAFAIERVCTGSGCNNPDVITPGFLSTVANGGNMLRPDLLFVIGQEPDWGNWQLTYILSPSNNLGAAPWSFDDLAHGIMAGLIVNSIPDVVFRLNLGYMHRTLHLLSAPGNTRISGNPVNSSGITTGSTGWFVSAGIDWDIAPNIDWTFTGTYLQNLSGAGFDKFHLSHLLSFSDIGGIPGLGIDFRNTWIDNGANTTRRFLTEFDVAYSNAFGVDGLTLSFDTNWLLDWDWSHISFDFLPRIRYDSGSSSDPRIRFQADATFNDIGGPFGYREFIIGGIPNNQGNRVATPIVSFNWDTVTLNLFGRATFDENFELVGGTVPVTMPSHLTSGWGTQTGVQLLVEPIFGEVDLSVRFNQFWNNNGFQGANVAANLSGPISDYIDFRIGANASFDGNFGYIGGSFVLGLEKDAEFHSNHTFVSSLAFNFDGNFDLDYIEWRNSFNLTPGSASGYGDISAFFDARVPFSNWQAQEVRYRYGLTLTHTF